MKYLAFFPLLLISCAAPQPGQLSGKVTYDGPRREVKQLTMEAEEACQKLHPNGVADDLITVAGDKALANAFVYIKAGLDGKKHPPPVEKVVIEQKGCRFQPRVLALQVGQTLAVINNDPVSHNIHPTPKENRDWNQQQPPGAEPLERRFGFPEVMIPVKCNIHNWMRTYIGVLDHPFMAVTPAAGTYNWSQLPPGTYTVAAWHESLGEITQDVSVHPGQKTQLDIIFH